MKQSVTITGENLNVVMNNVETANVSSKKTKAEKRMETLRALGYDMSKYFTLGDDQVVEIKDGKAVPVDFVSIAPDADEVEKKLVEGGYVNNWKLFRRWVTSQMFHMLRNMALSGNSFNGLLQRKGYEYQWKMLEREVYAQVKMEKHGDTENAKMRNLYFNGNVAADMVTDYIGKLKYYINTELTWRKQDMNKPESERKYKHTCHGVPYVRLQSKNIFVCDLPKKVYSPLYEMASDMAAVPTYEALYKLVHKFNKMRKSLPSDTKQSMSFICAYKGSGSYYTMRNLIMFHGAKFRIGGKFTSQATSLKHLDLMANEHKDEPWRMLGILKELIKDSGISIKCKIDEWKK